MISVLSTRHCTSELYFDEQIVLIYNMVRMPGQLALHVKKHFKPYYLRQFNVLDTLT
jgi:hypothetical protein